MRRFRVSCSVNVFLNAASQQDAALEGLEKLRTAIMHAGNEDVAVPNDGYVNAFDIGEAVEEKPDRPSNADKTIPAVPFGYAEEMHFRQSK
jgi:hypothetical protein